MVSEGATSCVIGPHRTTDACMKEKYCTEHAIRLSLLECYNVQYAKYSVIIMRSKTFTRLHAYKLES